MRVKLIGIGAAGNKAAICAIEEKVIKTEDVLLVNSTLRDIPKDYKGTTYQFESTRGGCGKERNRAIEYVKEDVCSDKMPLNKFLAVDTPNEAELVIIVSSTEGGTGSGAAPIIAAYIWQALGIKVHLFSFVGFGEDARGLRNTVEYFSEMSEEFTIESIENAKYLAECNGNKLKAEKRANSDFCRKIAVLIGNALRDSEHNIDPTDLYKISTTAGYMIIEFKEFSKIKNKEQFRTTISNMLDESKAIDISSASQKKMAVIINIDKESTDIIDYHDILVDRFGAVFEKFEHIQHESDMPNFIAVISAGLKMPKEEIDEIYKQYSTLNKSVDKKKDGFFAASTSYAFDDEDNEMFNVQTPKKMDTASFFASVKNNGSKNKEVKEGNSVVKNY